MEKAITMNGEVWATIRGCNSYAVSNMGRVKNTRNVSRLIWLMVRTPFQWVQRKLPKQTGKHVWQPKERGHKWK